MDNDRLKIIFLAVSLSFPLIAKANMVWPSVFIVQQYYSWYVILIGLIVEIVAAHMFIRASWKRSIIMMAVANAVSAILGLLLIPISGIAVEILTLPLGEGTFSRSHWVFDYIFAVLVNTCVEGLALKWIFKYPFYQNFWWLFGANLISVILCVFVPYSY